MFVQRRHGVRFAGPCLAIHQTRGKGTGQDQIHEFRRGLVVHLFVGRVVVKDSVKIKFVVGHHAISHVHFHSSIVHGTPPSIGPAGNHVEFTGL